MGRRTRTGAEGSSYQRNYFRETDDGRLLYAPYGHRGIPALTRRSYVVPSNDLAGDIERLHRRFSAATTVVAVAIFGVFISLVLLAPDVLFASLAHTAAV